jgi:hypothetical protein
LSAAEIADLGTKLLQHCSTHEKIALAAKTGALEGVTAALRVHATSRDAAASLLPTVINLSSGDDKKGLDRVGTFTQLGVIETLAEVMRATPDDATVAIRCVWALQHICRRGTSGAAPWLSRLLHSGVSPLLCNLANNFPEDNLLQTRILFLIASVCYSLTNSGIAAGMAASVSLNKAEERANLLPVIVAALKRDPWGGAPQSEAIEPRVGEEVCALNHALPPTPEV